MKILKKNHIIGFILFALVFFSSCKSQYIRPSYQADSFTLDSMNQKSLRVVVNNNIQIEEFEKTFRKHFSGSKEILTNHVGRVITNNLRNSFSTFNVERFDSVYNIESAKNAMLNNIEKVDSTSDYILLIDNIIVSNQWVYNGQSNTELCKFTYNATLYERKTKRLLLKFDVEGVKAVYFFDFKESFLEAIRNASNHMVGYIRNRTIEF